MAAVKRRRSKLDPVREAALKLLSRGEATLTETAELAKVDRQLVFYWADSYGVDWQTLRERRLKRLWNKLASRPPSC